MICIIDEKNIIVNIVNAEKPLAGDEVAFYPWNRLGALYTDVEPLDYARERYFVKAKAERDAGEVEPITYNGNVYDYDDKARERMRIAEKALIDNNIESQEWTCADNTKTMLTVADFKAINTIAARRSGILHDKYNALKDSIKFCLTIEEVQAITFDGETTTK